MPDISQITLPNGTTYDIKDSVARAASGGGGGSTWYGACSTSASTQKKVVDVGEDFELVTGVSVIVYFSNAQSYNGVPQLNVSSTGAKNIVRNGTTNAGQNEWKAGQAILFVYDGTYWVITDGTTATTSTPGKVKLEDSYSSTSTTTAATPNAVKAAYDLANGKQSALTFDTTPTANSTNPVTSGGIYTELETVKTSVSNGKSAIASAITDKGVSTSSSDSFATMASNIEAISTGIDFEGESIPNVFSSSGSINSDNIVNLDGITIDIKATKSISQKNFFKHPTETDTALSYCKLEDGLIFCFSKNYYWVFRLDNNFNRTEVSSGNMPTNTDFTNSGFSAKSCSYNGNKIVFLLGSYRKSSSYLYHYVFALNLNNSYEVTKITSSTIHTNTANQRSNITKSIACIGDNAIICNFSAENNSTSTSLCLCRSQIHKYTYTSTSCTVNTTAEAHGSSTPYDVDHFVTFISEDTNTVVVCPFNTSSSYPAKYYIFRRTNNSSTFSLYSSLDATYNQNFCPTSAYFKDNYLFVVGMIDYVSSGSTTDIICVTFTFNDDSSTVSLETTTFSSLGIVRAPVIAIPTNSGFIVLCSSNYFSCLVSDDGLITIGANTVYNNPFTYQHSSSSGTVSSYLGVNCIELFDETFLILGSALNTSAANYVYLCKPKYLVSEIEKTFPISNVFGSTISTISSNTGNYLKSFARSHYTYL